MTIDLAPWLPWLPWIGFLLLAVFAINMLREFAAEIARNPRARFATLVIVIAIIYFILTSMNLIKF